LADAKVPSIVMAAAGGSCQKIAPTLLVTMPECRTVASPPVIHMKNMERVKGIEPSYDAWEAPALPLSYTRVG
jgi:hypothetical protein